MNEQESTTPLEPTEEASIESAPDVQEEMTVEALLAQIETLNAELKVARNAQAHSHAESYNAQMRAEREIAKVRKYASEKFAQSLLEVVDNLERALDAAAASDSKDEALLEGVRLTHKTLLNALEKNAVIPISPQTGEDFDANVHEAVGIDPDAQAGKVGELLQKGYSLQDRLLRPAVVRVGQ